MRKRIGNVCLAALCIIAIIPSVNGTVAGSGLDELLKRTGRTVEFYWQQIDSFACTELVTQEKIGKKQKIEFKTDSTFDYLALTKYHENGLAIEELRLPQKRSPDKSQKPSLLATNGFPTLLLIFHPRYQANYQYRLEPESVESSGLLRVHFEQIPGMRSTCALVLQERIYPLELRGSAWIDNETGTIRKVAADLISPLKDINIKAFSVEVVYRPETFSPDPEARWLPSTATINVQTALQHWRNVHRYSQYRRFTVQSLETGQNRMNGPVNRQAE